MHGNWGFFVLGIIFLTVVVPMWLSAHYGTRWRQAKRMTPDSERMLAEMAELADKLQARIRTHAAIIAAQAGIIGKPVAVIHPVLA